MATGAWETVVLGAGPVGLVAALAAVRRGRTLIITQQLPTATAPLRLDSVPAPLLALLLEIGVHPARLGVCALHDARLVAWENATPELRRGPAAAHIDRSVLEHALSELIGRTPGIEVAIGTAAAMPPGAGLAIDATGRRAISARRRIGPPQPWVARSLWCAGSFTAGQQAFRLAALPDGYAYRLGDPGRLMLGIVGERTTGQRLASQIACYLRESGAGWLLAGLPALERMHPGRGGVASVQWSEGGAMVRAGDAALARDALAAQGLATGIADVLRLAAGEISPGLIWAQRQREQRTRHLATMQTMLAQCRFRDSRAWSRYASFLAAE